MKGTYSITVKNNILQYQFEVRRNITIVKGDSATGKTTLIEMIREYYENGEASGISLQCEKTCVVLEGRQWKILLENIHDSIVFIDEGNEFVASVEFALVLKQSDNYYVIVTRERLSNLPYSVNEIYGIKMSGKYGKLQQTYQEFFHIYGNANPNRHCTPEIVVVEDSNAGYDFFNEVSKDKSWKVISAHGKSNIFKLLNDYTGKRILVIADGAAFGAEADRIMKKISENKEMVIYLPESFEWLILNANVLKDKQTEQILENPSVYIESREYMSWEQFFTAFLIEITKDTYLKYSKSKLNDSYKNRKILDKILGEIPEYVI